MQARYLLVRGVPGKLVAHPTAESRRYLGKSPQAIASWSAGPIDETGKPKWPASEPVNEVIRDDGGYLRKMVRNGGLVLVAECIAASADEAEQKLAAMPQEK